MSLLELVLVAAVMIGMSVQGTIGFGFALFAAPAAFAAFSATQAVLLIQLLGIAINCLVLLTERRRVEISAAITATVAVVALPGMLAGVWIADQVSKQTLQLLVGVIVLAGVAIQSAGARTVASRERRSPGLEAATGLVSGVLSTSVSINGPPLVLTYTHLGLRGSRLRDMLAAGLLALGVGAAAILLLTAGVEGEGAGASVWIGCVLAMLVGHRFGAAAFRRLDDASHHRAALAAAALAGLLSIAAALL